MIVYNITIKIFPAIKDEWVAWQKHEHIPDIMATGLFYDHKFYHLLEQDETDGITFIIQYFAETEEKYERYLFEHAVPLLGKAFAKWGEKFLAFRTVMEVVN
jgi:hypothetical protein